MPYPPMWTPSAAHSPHILTWGTWPSARHVAVCPCGAKSAPVWRKTNAQRWATNHEESNRS